MKGSNKVNKNTTGSSGPCKGCEDEKPIEVTNRFVVEEETIIIAEGNSSPETDEDLFE